MGRAWLGWAILALGAAPLQGQEVLAIIGADVVTMTGQGVLRDRTVLIEDGMITAIGPEGGLALPAGTRPVPAHGLHLAPGLVDFHVHLRSTSELTSYLRHGVTSIVQLSGGLAWAPDVLAYRDAIRTGELAGPTLYASGPILDGAPAINPGVSVEVTTPGEAREAVREQAARGYDLIKVYNRLPAAALEAAIDEAHALGLPVAGHIPRPGERSTALGAALEAGIDVIAHGEEIFFTRFHAGVDSLLDLGEVPWRGEEGVEDAARAIAEAGAVVIPNLSFVAATRTQLDSVDVLWADPEFAFLEPGVRRFWREGHFGLREGAERFGRRERAKEEFLDRLTLALHRTGVPLLLGTDASFVGLFPGASAHLELRQLVEAGLTPAEAYATGTVVPGAFLLRHGMTPVPVGVVAKGARADLVLLEGNPLEDVDAARDPVGVVAGGRWYPRDRLDALRAGPPGGGG